MPTTNDGVEFGRGDTVWVLRGDCAAIDKQPAKATVEMLFPSPDGTCRKGTLRFENEEREDWRLDVWSTKEAAEAALAETIVMLKLDKDDAHFIWHQLADGFARVKQELEILRITKERELTKVEKSMLPATLFRYSREQLQEQIDPWISYLQHFIWLMNQMKVETISREQEMVWCYGEERARELMTHDRIMEQATKS